MSPSQYRFNSFIDKSPTDMKEIIERIADELEIEWLEIGYVGMILGEESRKEFE